MKPYTYADMQICIVYERYVWVIPVLEVRAASMDALPRKASTMLV
jgi:hypothetical protein